MTKIKSFIRRVPKRSSIWNKNHFIKVMEVVWKGLVEPTKKFIFCFVYLFFDKSDSKSQSHKFHKCAHAPSGHMQLSSVYYIYTYHGFHFHFLFIFFFLRMPSYESIFISSMNSCTKILLHQLFIYPLFSIYALLSNLLADKKKCWLVIPTTSSIFVW